MAYTKNTWNTGDIVSSQKLNHMEDGIANAGGTLVIGGFSYDAGLDVNVGTSDKTWQEIDNALAAGARCVVVFTNADGHSQKTITGTVEEEGKYKIFGTEDFDASTTSTDGYPTIENT